MLKIGGIFLDFRPLLQPVQQMKWEEAATCAGRVALNPLLFPHLGCVCSELELC